MPSPRDDNSGLIDIRAMAAHTLAVSHAAPADRPALAAPLVLSPAPTPILLPTDRSSTPGWIWALLGAIAVAIVGLGALLFALLRAPAPPAPVHPAVAAAPPPAVAVAPTAPAPGPAPAATAPPPSPVRRPPARRATPLPSPTAPVAAPRPAEPPRSRDDLTALLDNAAPTPTRAAHAPPFPDETLPATPSRAGIVSAMQSARPRFDACFAQFHIPGVIPLQLSLSNHGRVLAATVSGPLAGTPTADCLTRATHSATFQPFQQTTYSITWPIILH
jgi:hypothetical protein